MALVPDRLCVIVGRTRHKMVMVELQEAVKRGAKFIELRLDYLAKAVDFQRLLPLKACPWVISLRRREDGGRWTGTEAERMTILRQAIVAGIDWVDLETDVADKVPRFRDVKRIISYHNMQETPSDLEGIFQNMLKQDADVLKIAVMAQTPLDNLRVLRLVKGSPKPLVAHCMGDMGFPSRLLSLKYGAPFTYAAFNKERGIAPGLPSYEELKRTYPIDTIDAKTRVFGVLGDPVAHSFSPTLHNQAYRKLGLNALYLPFRVPRGGLAHVLKEFDKLPIEGYSVTIPHKEAAMSIAKQVDERVQETQAANTLVRADGGFSAFNTDYDAAMESLEEAMPPDENGIKRTLKMANVMVLGAGGVSRSLAHALHRRGALVKIAGRTFPRAEKLAEEVQGKVVEWETRHNGECDVLINGTPVGMHPNVDDCPVHHSYLRPGMVVFDTIYTPENTLLVKQAKARGSNVVTGVEMFVRQAARQMELFVGERPDLEMLRDVMRKALSPVTYKAPIVDDGEDD
jgi:3-dehydroquinate dehydratase / shikimate dehydrogenase